MYHRRLRHQTVPRYSTLEYSTRVVHTLKLWNECRRTARRNLSLAVKLLLRLTRFIQGRILASRIFRYCIGRGRSTRASAVSRALQHRTKFLHGRLRRDRAYYHDVASNAKNCVFYFMFVFMTRRRSKQADLRLRLALPTVSDLVSSLNCMLQLHNMKIEKPSTNELRRRSYYSSMYEY
jgi:hypothetical protein